MHQFSLSSSSPRIAHIDASEVLDSRGHPTIEVCVELADGSQGIVAAPAGASTGTLEARELRDGDPSRYAGLGVLRAIDKVENVIAPRLAGMRADEQHVVDAALDELDGTESKFNLGGNATVAVSLACAHAAAAFYGMPLYQYLGGPSTCALPVPMFNVLNGGKHAPSGPDIQEFKIVPLGAPTFREALRYGAEVYRALYEQLSRRGQSTCVGDEGGFAPTLASNEEAMQLILRAIESAGYRVGDDIAVGLDPAASSFHDRGMYYLKRDGLALTSDEMIAYWAAWIRKYPIVSLEDPLADEDWTGFEAITRQLGDDVQLVGDDLFVTHRRLLLYGIAKKCCNSILIKPNQIGTLTETLETVNVARRAGYGCLVSHRSGETADATIADLAVAIGCGQIKSGAPARGERVAKYNRLLHIERKLGAHARYAGKDAFRQWLPVPEAKPEHDSI